MSKTYIIDTNVFLHDPKALFSFKDNEVVIPLVVLDELDKKKSGHDEVARHARETIRMLDEMRAIGSIHQGVKTESGGIIRVEINHKNNIPSDLDPDKADNRIISVALGVMKDRGTDHKVTVVSKDINLRVKCDALCVSAEDYNTDAVAPNANSIYSGIKDLIVNDQIITDINAIGHAPATEHMYENQYALLRSDTSPKHSALVRFKGGNLVKINPMSNIWGISPRNKEQACAIDALFNPDIKLVTLIGSAGSGKTLAATAAGISQLIDLHTYKKMIISRPIVPMGKDIGYLPGPQPLDAKILTPTGWELMGNITPGSIVIGRDGKPTNVLRVFPKGEKDVYKIYTSDGTSTECCEDHLWLTRTWDEKKRNKNGSVKNTAEIINTMRNKRGKLNHYLPRNQPVEFDRQDTVITPYVMGVILGDGSISNSITISNTDNELIKRCEIELNSIGAVLSHNGGINYNIKNKNNNYNNKPAMSVKITDLQTKECVIYNSIGEAVKNININRSTLGSRCKNSRIINNFKYEFLDDAQRWTNIVKNEIFKLGLHKCNHITKFIPNKYKYSSIDDRIQLLRGLMDTDGCAKKNGEASFTTTSLNLANDIVELVMSLGGRAKIRERNRVGKTSQYSGRIIRTTCKSYEFNISLPKNINPFYISRKANRHNCNYIFDARIEKIEKIGKKHVQCILVENPEHLYITDGFIVTHNTMDDKMRPWMAPIQDNLELLFSDKGGNYIDMYREQGIIEVEALTYIRGRSIPRSYIIIDECLTAGHQVSMADGTVKLIENIIAGDTVLSLDMKNNIPAAGKVEGVISRMTDNVWNIKTSSGILECTENHPIYVFNDFKYTKKSAAELRAGDFIPTPKYVPHETSNNVSENLAYFVGMIIADGHIEKNFRTVKVAVRKDTDHFEKMFKLGAIELNCHDAVKVNINSRGDSTIGFHRVNIISKLSSDFNIPSGKKSHIIKVPDKILTAPIQSIRSFISACFDADGDINITKSGSLVINYTSASRQMVIGIQHLLRKFGINSSIYFDIKKVVNNKERFVNRVCLTGINAYDYWKKIGFVMERKQDVLDTHFTKTVPLDTSRIPIANILRDRLKLDGIRHRDKLFSNIAHSKTISRYMINDRYSDLFSKEELSFINSFNFSEIRSIIKSESSVKVYDFKVKDFGTFCVNGLISSNCQNLTRHEVKTIITRVGEDSKIVLTGDILQIDNPFIDSVDNGLSYVVEKFKNDPIAAHITLHKGERSELATKAAELL